MWHWPNWLFLLYNYLNSSIHIWYTCFWLGNPNNFKEFSIRYILNKEYHNKGYCSEVEKTLIDYGINHFDMHRVISKCNPENVTSFKRMEKVSLIKEVHLKERVFVKKTIQEILIVGWIHLWYYIQKLVKKKCLN